MSSQRSCSASQLSCSMNSRNNEVVMFVSIHHQKILVSRQFKLMLMQCRYMFHTLNKTYIVLWFLLKLCLVCVVWSHCSLNCKDALPRIARRSLLHSGSAWCTDVCGSIPGWKNHLPIQMLHEAFLEQNYSQFASYILLLMLLYEITARIMLALWFLSCVCCSLAVQWWTL